MKTPLTKKAAPSVVCIGGGTGLSTMLRGLKVFFPDITAIVTVADDGGGSGILREELGMLPPGDIRNCILALSNIEPTMQALLSYRFESGSLTGQSFGNLFLAALNGMSASFDEAVTKMCEVLAITGRVLPVTNEDVQLVAEFADGTSVMGESKIFHAKSVRDCDIKTVKLLPERPKALPQSIEAIKRADIIILGPGSLYTSILPNLLVEGVSESIEESSAMKLYICNIMTQGGETEQFTVSRHIKELFFHSGRRLFDVCLANSFPATAEVLKAYAKEGAEQLFADKDTIKQLGVQVFEAPLLSVEKGRVRHDSYLLAGEIFRIYRDLSETKRYDIL